MLCLRRGKERFPLVRTQKMFFRGVKESSPPTPIYRNFVGNSMNQSVAQMIPRHQRGTCLRSFKEALTKVAVFSQLQSKLVFFIYLDTL